MHPRSLLTTGRSPGKIRLLLAAFAAGMATLFAAAAFGQDAASGAAESGLDSGDVAWLLTSSAIVLMMTIPGLALFYGGLVRDKNVLSVFMHCFITAALVSVTWVLWGYSIAFGNDVGGLFGDLSKFGMAGVSHVAGPDESYPELLNMVFQMMFAIITPALIAGAVAERMKFPAFLLFITLWSTFVYAPICHWVWGGGWLGERGGLDFAGGTVVHLSSGVSALVAALVLGRRKRVFENPAPPHNVPFVVMGAALLWVGWFGFNAGSALAADGIAVLAFANTNTATGAAVIAWMATEWARYGKPTAVGAATGAVSGLVAITPAAGFVNLGGALIIGFAAGLVCFWAVRLHWKQRLGYDDALDVVGVHGVGGLWGALATGVFVVPALNGGTGGLFYTGEASQFIIQLEGVLATIVYAGIGTGVILGVINFLVGLRVSDEVEIQGLDVPLHAESAYGRGD